MSDSAVATNGGGAAPAAPATPGAQGGEAPEQQPGWGEMLKGILWRFLIMYFIMNLFKGNKSPAAPNATTPNGQVATTNVVQARNLFARGTIMDMYLYISEFERMKWKDDQGDKSNTGTLCT